MVFDRRLVVVNRVEPKYPDKAPYSASEFFPESLFKDVAAEENTVYSGVRQLFRAAGLDKTNAGLANWNPLGDFLSPGQSVLLKPNMVKETHPRDSAGWMYVITHGSVVRAVADYVWKAIGPAGRIIVADAPQTDSSFARVAELMGLPELQVFYASQGLDFSVIDLRNEEWISTDGVITQRTQLRGDPRGGVAFDLGSSSEFVGHLGSGSYYGADYDADVVNRHHSNGRHEYLIAGSVLDCDVIVSLPKLKTHKKAGITVSLKNLIGINADKNWLPHHTEGPSDRGGDERPRSSRSAKLERDIVQQLRSLALRFPRVGTRVFRLARIGGARLAGPTESTVRSGNWWGNDTLWRTCLDLNKILLYGDSTGNLPLQGSPEVVRQHLVVVDGIVAGDGNGPMDPDPVEAGLLLFGANPASVDAGCAVMMGLDPRKIPIVRQAFECEHLPLVQWKLEDVQLSNSTLASPRRLFSVPADDRIPFRPHFGWTGHIELEQS